MSEVLGDQGYLLALLAGTGVVLLMTGGHAAFNAFSTSRRTRVNPLWTLVFGEIALLALWLMLGFVYWALLVRTAD